MRPLYFLLRILLPYVMWIFYKESKTLNSQKKFNAQTIFVCNHPSAFIDPLVAGNFQLPVLYFVTRGDIFKKWLHPVTWASHMVPIFRKAEDGADSHEKNKDSFRYLRKVLKRKKSLILFGEGYTDDVFIRSLKVIKKGPARIGFDTMVESNWTEDIKVQPMGLNYTHPKHFRSSVLVSCGELIYLKDYQQVYEENPSLAITQLTRRIQTSMQEQITYVDRKELAPFVENILILTRKGMNHFHHDSTIKLEKRYRYSQKVANRINENYADEDERWAGLKTEVDTYFEELNQKNINENWVHKFGRDGRVKTIETFLIFLLLLPFTLVGLVHQLIPYLIIKRFVENTFKRDVFWSGVKLMVGAVISTLYNIAFIFLFHAFIYPSYWLGVAYFLIVPVITGIIAYKQINNLKDTLHYRKAKEEDLRQLANKRCELLHKLTEMELT